MLTYGIESEQLTVFPQNPVLSNHFLITFEFTLLDYTASEKNFTYTRCLSENAVTSFKELISSSFFSLPCSDITEDSYLNFTPVELDSLVDSAIVSMRTTLDNVAPLKRMVGFLFSTVARLTKSPSSVEPCIPLSLSSYDFMRFFINKIVSIREKIDGILPTIITDVSSSAAALET